MKRLILSMTAMMLAAMCALSCEWLEKPQTTEKPGDVPAGQKTTAPSLTLESTSLPLVYPVQCDIATVLTFGVSSFEKYEYEVSVDEGVDVSVDTTATQLKVSLQAMEQFKATVVEVNVKVSNSAGEAKHQEFLEKAYISLASGTPANFEFPQAGGQAEVSYETNMNAAVNATASWIVIASKSEGRVVFGANKYTGEGDQTGELTIGDKYYKVSFPVKQLGDNTALQLEREALMAFYNTLNGEDWEKTTADAAGNSIANWGTDKPVWEWYGVTCQYGDGTNGHPLGEPYGHVTSLTLGVGSLGGDVMVGTLPEELKNLTLCYQFELVGEPRLTGNIDVVFQMKSLTRFCMDECGLDFCIDDWSSAQVERVKKCQIFRLNGNNITGHFPSWYAECPIGLGGNRLTGEIPYEVWSQPGFVFDWYKQQDGYELTLGPAPGE